MCIEVFVVIRHNKFGIALNDNSAMNKLQYIERFAKEAIEKVD